MVIDLFIDNRVIIRRSVIKNMYTTGIVLYQYFSIHKEQQTETNEATFCIRSIKERKHAGHFTQVAILQRVKTALKPSFLHLNTD